MNYIPISSVYKHARITSNNVVYTSKLPIFKESIEDAKQSTLVFRNDYERFELMELIPGRDLHSNGCNIWLVHYSNQNEKVTERMKIIAPWLDKRFNNILITAPSLIGCCTVLYSEREDFNTCDILPNPISASV